MEGQGLVENGPNSDKEREVGRRRKADYIGRDEIKWGGEVQWGEKPQAGPLSLDLVAAQWPPGLAQGQAFPVTAGRTGNLIGQTWDFEFR